MNISRPRILIWGVHYWSFQNLPYVRTKKFETYSWVVGIFEMPLKNNQQRLVRTMSGEPIIV